MFPAVGSGTGTFPAFAGYRLVEATAARRLEAFQDSAIVRREIDYVRARIGSIASVEELVDDYRLFRFALTAFGLESQVGSKALMKRVLGEDWRESKALTNRLVDPRYREIARAFDFALRGTGNLHSESFVGALIDRYVTAEFEKSTSQINPAVRSALYFKRVAPQMKTWLQVLGDRPMLEVLKTVLGVPTFGSVDDLDKQVRFLERRIGLANFKDQSFVERLVMRFLAAHDQQSQVASGSAASVLLSNGTATNAGSDAVALAGSMVLTLASRR